MMSKIFEQFYNNLLPGNYALTKSMELTRAGGAGTLWYMKKFLVLYYYIFLSNEIYTQEYINNIIQSFDNYISDMDESVRESAVEFFYPKDNEAISLKSQNFITFIHFAGNFQHASENEKRGHLEMAKKYYFALLMGTGGQSGVNKYIKQKMYEKNFVFHHDTLKKIIYTYYKNKKDINYMQIISDYMASIRNERQILYYFGYFHSKTTGARDMEFSSLTPVGEIGLISNSREFQCIWEHQKLKMISQPITVKINGVNVSSRKAENFSISYNPYMDILRFLNIKGKMEKTDYQYIVSRKSSQIQDKSWYDEIDIILSNRDKVISKIESFNRKSDIKSEDGNKELLKYLLSIRNDIPKDKGSNPLGVCRIDNGRVCIVDTIKLNRMLKIYENICRYKESKYRDLFENCENELRKYYISQSNSQLYHIDSKKKILWDLYNIKIDRMIIMSVVLNYCLIELNLEFENCEDNSFIDNAYKHFPNILRSIGINNVSSLKKEVKVLCTCFVSDDFDYYIHEEEKDEYETDRQNHLLISSRDLMNKIRASSENVIPIGSYRKRNASLISQMKTFYILNFSGQDKLLKCECCGETTFVTNSGEPYIEFHHLIPFGSGVNGPDHYFNLYGLCPNCHRKMHFMSVTDKESYYRKINNNNYLKENFVSRLKKLKQSNVLRSYHLEYLLADKTITSEEYEQIVA